MTNAGGAPSRPLAGARGWIITDGKAGMDVQVRGVADALGLAYEQKLVEPKGLSKIIAPWGPVARVERFGEPGGRFGPPWPVIAIATGRASIPYIRALKRKAGPQTYTVVLQDPKTGPGTALPWDTKVETCLGCHAPGTGERENMGVVAPKMLRDIVHPVHLNSPSWRQDGTYKGNCFTCHNIDGQGRFTLLGEKLDKDFRGIPKNVPVPGIPPSETTR